MKKRIIKSYLDSFSGLSKEIWLLSFITFINRAGTMVIPFLALYLTKHRNFYLEEVGWIFAFFGLGSVTGSWLGGKLTDNFGHYRILTLSLFSSAILFILLQFPQSFWGICIGVFFVMTVAETYRPAVFVALNAYSKPENRTRSITLIRLAVNLGFSVGPAIGGLIIANVGYSGIFWMDGISCFVAGILLLKLLSPTKGDSELKSNVTPLKSVWNDKLYLIFILGMIIFSFIFLQYFSTVPLYYAKVYDLNEAEIGLLLGFNGLIIFLFGMPLVKFMETRTYTPMDYIILGTILLGLSFLILNIFGFTGILLIGMLIGTIGEMVGLPFSNSFAIQRSDGKKRGSYMALYSMGFSVSHLIGHNSGMQLIENFGFNSTWNVMFGLAIFASLLFYFLKRYIKLEANHLK